MSVPVCCPHCRAQCLFGDEFHGRTVQCLYCGKQMRLPPREPGAPAPERRPAALQPRSARAPVPVRAPQKSPITSPPAPPPVVAAPHPLPPGSPGPPRTPALFQIARWLWKHFVLLLALLCVGLFRGGRWLGRHPRVLMASMGVALFLCVTYIVYNAFRGSDRPGPTPSQPGGEAGSKGLDALVELITLGDDPERLTCAVFSRDGTLLLTGSHEGSIKSWPLLTRKPLPLLKLHRKVACLAVSPTDPALAVATGGDLGWESVKLWDPAATKEPPPLPWPDFADFERPQGQLVFTPDGGRLLAGGQDRVVVWDTRTHAIVTANQWFFASTAALDPDGKTLATAAYPGIAISELTERPYVPGKPLPAPTLRKRLGQGEGEDYDLFALTFGPGGRLAARARRQLRPTDDPSTAGDAVILSEVKGKWLAAAEPFRAHDEGRVWIRTETVRYSPDGKKVASGGSGWLGLWDADTGKVLASIREPDTARAKEGGGGWGEPVGVTFAPNGRTVASVWMDGKVRLWTPRPAGP